MAEQPKIFHFTPAFNLGYNRLSSKCYSISGEFTTKRAKMNLLTLQCAGPSGRAAYGIGLQPLACCDRGFESHPGLGCLCCECCLLSGRGLCDELITRPEQSYRLWRVIVCDHETSQARRLKPTRGL